MSGSFCYIKIVIFKALYALDILVTFLDILVTFLDILVTFLDNLVTLLFFRAFITAIILMRCGVFPNLFLGICNIN